MAAAVEVLRREVEVQAEGGSMSQHSLNLRYVGEELKALARDYIAATSELSAEVAGLKSDIERHIAIASQLATEVEGLRAERDRLKVFEQVVGLLEAARFVKSGKINEAIELLRSIDSAALGSPPAAEENKHVCGLQGYDPMKDPRCPGCVDRHRPTEGDGT